MDFRWNRFFRALAAWLAGCIFVCTVAGTLLSSKWFIAPAIGYQICFCAGAWLLGCLAFGHAGQAGMTVRLPWICLALMLFGLIVHPILTGLPSLTLRRHYLSATMMWCAATAVLQWRFPSWKHWCFHVIAAVSAAGSIVCWAQKFGWMPSGNPYFNVTGLFNNPNVTAMLLAFSMPVWCRHIGWGGKTGRMLAAVAGLFIGTAIWWTGCRTAMLGALAVLVLMAEYRFGLLRRFWHNSAVPGRTAAIAGVLLCLGLVCIGLYRMKPVSADARLRIWNQTVACIRQHPVEGYGFGRFEHAFHARSIAQALDGTASEAMLQVRTSINMAYNDLLELTTEGGLLYGLLWAVFWISLLGPAFLRLLRTSPHAPDKAAAWCGAFAFCLMSSVNFCLSAASLSAIAMCYTGLLLGDTLRFSGQSAGSGRHTLRILLALMLLGGLFLQLRFAVAHVVLRNAAGTSDSSCNPEQLSSMVSLEKILRHSDAYWCTRAEKTAACGDYAAATDCLREALKYTNFAQVHHQMYLYCRKSGDTAGAVHALRQETGVTPGRLAPRYMLWQYYVSLQDTVHARETASDLIQATRFSDESIARRYRQIMQEYLDKSGGESVPGQTGRPVSD